MIRRDVPDGENWHRSSTMMLRTGSCIFRAKNHAALYHRVVDSTRVSADRQDAESCLGRGWPMSHVGQRRSSNDVCVTSPITPTAAQKPTFRHFAFVPCVDGSELARKIFTSRCWSVQPCVRPVGAVHMTAGHNALRGSGPGQNPAFDNALAHVGCPDRRIDRLCITCCSPSQPSHHTGCPARSRFTPQARRVAYNARP